jgi:hypothetical protein
LFTLSDWGSSFLFLVFREHLLCTNKCWIFQLLFPLPVNMSMWIFFFRVLLCLVTLVDFWMLIQLCIPGIDSTRLWYVILFIWCWVLLDNTHIHKYIRLAVLVCSFLVLLFMWFWYNSDTEFIKWVGNNSSSSIPGKNCVELMLFLLQMFGRIISDTVLTWRTLKYKFNF